MIIKACATTGLCYAENHESMHRNQLKRRETRVRIDQLRCAGVIQHAHGLLKVQPGINWGKDTPEEVESISTHKDGHRLRYIIYS